MTDLARRLGGKLQAQPDLIPTGSRVLVALSGGPDSTALLHLLVDLSQAHNWHIEAGHFDHGLRPESAREAEELAARIKALGVRLHVGCAEGQLRAAHEPMRLARYAWLEGVASEIRADRIATGHNLDDQAETVLFRILRGTGNRGLAGIPERRGRIARPLLSFTADEVRDWLSQVGSEAVDDPSNLDMRWARNRIRHELLPALEAHCGLDMRDRLLSIQAAAELVQRRTLGIARMALASAAGSNPNEYRRLDVLNWPALIRAEMFRLVARERQVRLTRGAAICTAAEVGSLRSGQGLDLGGGLRIVRAFDHLVFVPEMTRARDSDRLSIPGINSGKATLNLRSRVYNVRWGPENLPPGLARRVALSVHRDHYPLTVRGWEAGDRIRLPGGSRKLKRVFGEARVPVSERHLIPVVTDNRENVLWVAGLARCAEEATFQNTKLVIEIEDA